MVLICILTLISTPPARRDLARDMDPSSTIEKHFVLTPILCSYYAQDSSPPPQNMLTRTQREAVTVKDPIFHHRKPCYLVPLSIAWASLQ